MGRLKLQTSRISSTATSRLPAVNPHSWEGAKDSSKLYDHRWRKERKIYLQQNPYCAHCLPRFVPATDLDHKIPHRGDMVLFWDRSNWQGLCKPCHSRKTAKEDGGFGNG